MSCYCAVLKQANKVCVWPATKSELLTSAAQLIYTFRSVHFLINTSIIFLITCSPSSLIIRPSTHTEQMFSHLLLTISTLKRIRWLFINKNVFFFFLGTINAPPFHSILLLLCVRCLSLKEKKNSSCVCVAVLLRPTLLPLPS